ncbi:class I SAM-dependent methyltransferase [Arthrobacter sp. NPDC090010]|uniref:class I SAM-dependent methyltransferase n=1 Tax=Arthrobacter sp. NPDC090010 TaxID=3363942 RepID=UPI0038114AF5
MADLDSRLVELYDIDNPDGPDHDYYRSLVDHASARSVLDLGCGTGILTITFGAPGRRVVGIDPSPAMLAFARNRRGSERVDWILGDSRSIPPGAHDVAIMSGNVAQHIPDAEWPRTLADLHASLRPGGVLAFESRNPGPREWKSWTSAAPSERETPHGTLREWFELLQADVDGNGEGTVRLRSRNELDGEDLSHDFSLAFRSEATVMEQLDALGFDVRAVWGDWHRAPVQEDSRIFVVEAVRR